MIRIIFHLNLMVLLLIGFISPGCAGQLSVSAASSLSEAMRDIARKYETEFPGDQILLNFAGSQTLATQVEMGAPTDLIISANLAVMKRLQMQGLVEQSHPLLRNRLILATRRGLQPILTDVKDLARPDLLLAIGNHQVPVGDYTRQLFNGLATNPAYGHNLVKKIEANVVSQENLVKAIIAKLLLGEVDAGIVYQSDLKAGGAHQLNAISLPEEHSPWAVYPMAKVKGADQAIDRFIDYLQSESAQEVFAQCGFSMEVGQ